MFPQVVSTMFVWVRGNKKAGAGSMTITGDTPSSQVNIAMAFLKPFKSQSTVQFLIEPFKRWSPGHVDHEWQESIGQQSHERIHEHGQNDRQRLR
jgi:hypothetical protein